MDELLLMTRMLVGEEHQQGRGQRQKIPGMGKKFIEPLWSQKVIDQKLEYIHSNPVKANLCEYPEDYKYSSARFYIKNEKNWDFLTHIDE